MLELQCPRSVHPLTPGSWSDHADAFTPGESGVVTPHTLYCQHYIRALNETEAFCRLGIRQHLRVHLCQIHVHKTRKPASRLDLASFYLSQLDGQNKLKCSGTRRYLTVATLSRSLSWPDISRMRNIKWMKTDILIIHSSHVFKLYLKKIKVRSRTTSQSYSTFVVTCHFEYLGKSVSLSTSVWANVIFWWLWPVAVTSGLRAPDNPRSWV